MPLIVDRYNFLKIMNLTEKGDRSSELKWNIFKVSPLLYNLFLDCDIIF